MSESVRPGRGWEGCAGLTQFPVLGGYAGGLYPGPPMPALKAVPVSGFKGGSGVISPPEGQSDPGKAGPRSGLWGPGRAMPPPTNGPPCPCPSPLPAPESNQGASGLSTWSSCVQEHFPTHPSPASGLSRRCVRAYLQIWGALACCHRFLLPPRVGMLTRPASLITQLGTFVCASSVSSLLEKKGNDIIFAFKGKYVSFLLLIRLE